VSDELGDLPQPRRRFRPQWIVIVSAVVVVAAVLVVVLWPRDKGDVGDLADEMADALSNGDKAAFQSLVCQNMLPQPAWPDELAALGSVHVSVADVEDPGGSSVVMPSAQLVVDDTDIKFSMAVNKYDTRISDHPCVFALDRNAPPKGR
jgi:hypothetical protein